jgi:uncharacterized membrane protein
MSEKKLEPTKNNGFAIGKDNLKLMAIGFVVIIIGFILMSGGRSDNPNVFNKEIFNAQRIVIAPIVVVFGFLFEIWAIMKKTKEK